MVSMVENMNLDESTITKSLSLSSSLSSSSLSSDYLKIPGLSCCRQFTCHLMCLLIQPLYRYCHGHHHQSNLLCLMLLISVALIMMSLSTSASASIIDPLLKSSGFHRSTVEQPIDNDSPFIHRSPSNSVIKIKYGLLRGLIVNLDQVSSKNGTRNEPRLQPVKAYLGVPYASPPTGALRFMPPVTPAHWRGIRMADRLQPLCPQRIPYSDLVLFNSSTEALKRMTLAKFEWLRRIIPRMANQSEDCLYLNIYSPDLGSEWQEVKKKSSKYSPIYGRRIKLETNNNNDDNKLKPLLSSSSLNADKQLADSISANDDDPSVEVVNNNDDYEGEEGEEKIDGEGNNENHRQNNESKINYKNDGLQTSFSSRRVIIRPKRNLKSFSSFSSSPSSLSSFFQIKLNNTSNQDDNSKNSTNFIFMPTSFMITTSFQQKVSKRQRRSVGGNGADQTSHHHKTEYQHQKSSSSSSSSSSTTSFPVVVFLTGESYEWNPGSLYDGSILASFGQAVIVTLNFRLGILGFLPANIDGTIRGNYGLMDQVAALHWIQENIAQFGGSPSNITIVGHGYGAACAHLLMLSPMARGLFNRVILMSGSALSPWAIARDASVYAEQIGRQLNCPIKENSLIINCLRTRSIHQLQSVQYQVPDHLAGFGPIIDGIVIPQEPRILLHRMRQTMWVRQRQKQQHQQETPLNQADLRSHYHHHRYQQTENPTASSWSTLSAHLHQMHNGASGSSSQRPSSSLNHIIKTSSLSSSFASPDLMVGVTRVEVPTIFSSHEERNGISVARRDRLLRTLVRNLYDYHQQAIFYTLVNEYTDWTKPVEHPLNLMDSLMELYGDALVVAPLIESLDHHYAQSILFTSSFTTGPSSSSLPRSSGAYFYVFTYQNEQFSKQRFHEKLGAAYGDDLAFIFGVPFINWKEKFYEPKNNNNNQYHYPTLDISPNWYPLISNADLESPGVVQNRTWEIHLCQKFISSWINFAIRGDPNRENSPTRWSSSSSPSQQQPHPRHQQHKYQHSTTTATISTTTNVVGNMKMDQTKMKSLSSWSHDQWISYYGYQTVHTIGLGFNVDDANLHWHHYDTSKRRYIQFGSSIESRNHYHSHRLSVWLSLIPRLHVPIELKEESSSTSSLSPGSSSSSFDSISINQNDNYNFEPDQYFYLKHHLLPDHENPETYDGMVKELSIRIPKSKQWQQAYLRRNMTSLYEQHQQLLYGRLYDVSNVIINDDDGDGPSSSIRSHLSSAQRHNQQYTRRQIEQETEQQQNDNLKKKFKIQKENNSIQETKNNQVKQQQKKNVSNSNTSNNSLLHYETAEAQMSNETYSTLVLVSFFIGATLFLLNLIIVIGVYLQMKNNGRKRHQMASASGDDTQYNNENECDDMGYQHYYHYQHHHHHKHQSDIVSFTSSPNKSISEEANSIEESPSIANTNFSNNNNSNNWIVEQEQQREPETESEPNIIIKSNLTKRKSNNNNNIDNNEKEPSISLSSIGSTKVDRIGFKDKITTMQQNESLNQVIIDDNNGGLLSTSSKRQPNNSLELLHMVTTTNTMATMTRTSANNSKFQTLPIKLKKDGCCLLNNNSSTNKCQKCYELPGSSSYEKEEMIIPTTHHHHPHQTKSTSSEQSTPLKSILKNPKTSDRLGVKVGRGQKGYCLDEPEHRSYVVATTKQANETYIFQPSEYMLDTVRMNDANIYHVSHVHSEQRNPFSLHPLSSNNNANQMTNDDAINASNVAASYIDADGNFLSCFISSPVIMTTDPMSSHHHQDLSQLPYITLTEMYQQQQQQ